MDSEGAEGQWLAGGRVHHEDFRVEDEVVSFGEGLGDGLFERGDLEEDG